MKCSNCGNELKDGDLFCVKCGNKIEENNVKINKVAETTKNTKKKNVKLVVIIVITLIIIILVASLISMKLNKSNYNVNDNITKNTEQSALQQKYMKILSGDEEFKNIIGEYQTIKDDFKEMDLKYEESDIYYCIFDIDSDNNDEMYVEVRFEINWFKFVFNEENDIIYGFEFSERDLQELKTDGTFMGSGGASVHMIGKIIFNENNSTEVSLAEEDNGIYIIDNKSATEEEYNKFLNEFRSKEDIQLIEYKTNITNANETLNQEENTDNVDANFNNDIIKDRFKNSYSRLIEDINSYNISMATKNQNKKTLNLSKSGKIYALYNKQNQELQYIQYYGANNGGTELIWIDLEGDAERSVFEGYYGEKTMKPFIIKAVNVYGNVIDRRNENAEFSMNSAIIQMIENKDNVTTEEGKNVINAYILREFKWSIDSNDEILLEQIN